MRFIDICKRSERKRVLGKSEPPYAQLKHLRNLRNRVHIHSIEHERDHDYWNFNHKDFLTMKDVLKSIFSSEGLFYQ